MLASILITLAILVVCAITSDAMPPVIANVRGKKYELEAETVLEFCTQVEARTGIPVDEQSVLFRGKVFNIKDNLTNLGVKAGDVLNVVKGKKGVTPSSSISSKTKNDVDDITSSLGEDSDLEEKLKNMNPEELQKQAMKAMDAMLDSDFIDNYFGDDEKLEAARQQMLANIDQYANIPGFKQEALEVASSPEKWREAMKRAKEQLLQLKKERDELRASGKLPGANANSVDDLDDEDEE